MSKTAEQMKKLTVDLIEANKAASEAIAGMKDGGTANLDSVFLRIPRVQETAVLEVIRQTGLYCRGKRQWIGQGYMITPAGVGQGDTRCKAVTVMAKQLKAKGWNVMAYRQMD